MIVEFESNGTNRRIRRPWHLSSRYLKVALLYRATR